MPSSHILILLACNIVWGFNFVAGKIGTEIFSPLLFSAIRFAVVLLLLFPFLRWVPGQMKSLLLLGVIMGGGHYSIMFYAIHIGEVVGTVAIASQLVVPMSTLLAVVFLGERIQWIRTMAIAMSFLGVLIIGIEPVGPNDAVALLLSALAAFAMAIATIVMRNLRGIGVFNVQAWIALISTPILALLSISIEGARLEAFTAVELQQFWAPVYSGVGATIFGHGLMYWLLQRHPVNWITPFITLSTLFAVSFGIWLFDDPLTLRIMIGGLMTITGVFIISLRQSA